MPESLREAPKFLRWQTQLKANGLNIHHIEEVFTRHRYNGEALFSLLLLDATTPEGDKIPPVCFLKGEVVCVLICLIDQASGEKYLLLVKQRRICNGGYIFEQVAGMVDSEDDPDEVALRETEEESGLRLSPEQLHRLNEEPFFPSTGTSDEAMYFYYCELEMSYAEIMAYHDNQQGVDSEHERIVTHVAPIAEAKRLITNTNGLLNIYLYEEAVQA